MKQCVRRYGITDPGWRSGKSARGLAQSKTLARITDDPVCAKRLECGAFTLHPTRILCVRCATGLAIPKGLWPKAQGWRVCEPTLGQHPNEIINRNAVVALPFSISRTTLAATALRLEMLMARRPKVAAARQPWALRRNPFGIRAGNRAGRTLMDWFEADACKVQAEATAPDANATNERVQFREAARKFICCLASPPGFLPDQAGAGLDQTSRRAAR